MPAAQVIVAPATQGSAWQRTGEADLAGRAVRRADAGRAIVRAPAPRGATVEVPVPVGDDRTVPATPAIPPAARPAVTLGDADC